jgi:hypothetical protein
VIIVLSVVIAVDVLAFGIAVYKKELRTAAVFAAVVALAAFAINLRVEGMLWEGVLQTLMVMFTCLSVMNFRRSRRH